MVQLSSNLLFLSFILYLVSIFFFGGAIRDKKGEVKQNRWALIGISVTIAGFVSHLGYFILRWLAGGHAPVSNLFEFMIAFAMMLVGAFIMIYFIYKTSALGLFTLPIVLIIIAYGSMFSNEITPLIPALQTNWLILHVITAALGEAILAVSFGAGLIYLIKTVNHSKKSKQTFWLEIIMFCLISVLGFVFVTVGFKAMDYNQTFTYVDKFDKTAELEYILPAIAGPNEGELVSGNNFTPLFEVPAILNAKKLTTVLWSLLSGLVIYWLLRLIVRKRLAALLHPLVKNVNEHLADEICYRAVAIGFPIFSLGALIFAMIWAQLAWTRFWGWDPKEVWALITWLFYAAFLHLRLSKGWHGEKSAWLAVIGFAVIMFNLVAVNLVVAGLHSYAG